MSAIRVGVVGCGFQGQAHLEQLAAADDVEIVAIADLDERRLAEAGDRFGVEQRHLDAGGLLGQGLDLITVCTMPNTHPDLVIGALEDGAHVMCEKPLARSAAEAAAMVHAADQVGRMLIVGYNMRYMGATSAVRRFMAEGLLGELVCARGFMLADEVPWWGKHFSKELSGGGALNSTAVHMLDLLIWLADHPRPLTATASTATVFPHKRAKGAPAGAVEAYDVEDLIFGHVRFEGGFWLTIEGTWTYDRPGWNYSFDALGTRGQAHLQPLELFTERDGAPVRVYEDAPTEPDFNGSLADEMADVVASVRNGKPAERLATGHQALVVQAVADALYRSASEGREVAVEVPEI